MKHYRLILLFAFVLLSFSVLYGGTWGYPSHIWIKGFAVEDYIDIPGEDFDLTYSGQSMSVFSIYIRTYIGIEGYPISTADHGQYLDTAVTTSAMQNVNNEDMVWFTGHGEDEGYGPMFWNFNVFEADDAAYDYSTKWVFYDTCKSIYRSDGAIVPAFEGVHSIFGYASNVWQFKYCHWKNGSYVCDYSYQMPATFAQKWVRNLDPMYNAWTDAVEQEVVNDGGYSVAAGAYQVRGWIGSTYFNGNFQIINNTYSDPVPHNSSFPVWRNVKTWGTPSY